ncbi:MAG TPA: hypothetical protein VJ485_01015 [archaeon]|nr:hypothetical protein [archaeon]
MKFRIIALETFAIFVSYLVFSLTMVAATDVNIMFNGVVQDTAKYDHEKIINLQVSTKHDPNDVTWTNIKLAVMVNSASLSHSIKKIYLYKCRSVTPTECVRSTPQVFDNYADTELLWNDIYEKTGPAQYPQLANLLFLVKMEDLNKKESWVGMFTQTRRTNYNIFDTQQLSVQSIDLYAKSLDLVEPIKAYIENKFMIPFKWVSKAVFSGSTQLYGMGADSQDLETPTIQTAVVTGNEITNINKEFYFVSPKISSGIASPITLNLNPSFSCGNSVCESDIGETTKSCCYDCGCGPGQFCDTASNINLSACKDDGQSLSVISASSQPISDCAKGFNANISVRVSNPPASLSSQLQGTVSLNKTLYSVTCSGSSGSYECTIPLTSNIKCGSGSYVIGPGILNLTISYKDGPNSASKSLSASFSGVSVSYDCKCQDGSYCDSLKKTCQSEAAITLGITKLTSYLDNYNPGDRISLTAKIFNPPAGLVLVDKSATMNLTNGQVAPGTPDCSAPNSQFEYNCTIPFQISNYQKTQAYTFNPNTLHFTITYNDGPLAKTRTISAPFGPVSIPSQYCGDSQCNMGESQATCCLDCGCPSPGTQYCDKTSGCRNLDSLSISVNSVNPVNFTDCRQAHAVYLTIPVANAPTDISLDYFAYMQNGLVKGWQMKCDKVAVSIFNCTLVIPALESEGCSLPYKTISGNSINMTISFPDGKSKQIVRHLNAPFQDLYVTPVYHCGDGTCESSLGENPSVCCYDCPCKDSSSFGEDYYCDFDQQTYLGGCLPKSSISLVIDSPKVTVSLTSCEITNSVNVKAHIENQPGSARPQYFYATINGTAAEMVHCDQEQAFQGGNLSFNCTLMLPRIYMCSQGQTYTFSPNALSVLLSYQNGKQKTETQTLSAPLPTIIIRQGIRSLYDITQEGIAKMKQRLYRTIEIARDLYGAIKDCMETVKTLVYLQLVLTIAGAIAGSASTDTQIKTPQGGYASDPFSKAVAGAYVGSQIGGSLVQSYSKLCEFLQAQYRIDLEIQNMEIKMINMEMCMEVYQHQLDIGRCDKSPESCFTSITSCVNTGLSDVSSSADKLSDIVSKATNSLQQSTSILGSVYNSVGIVTGSSSSGGTTSIQMRCDERQLEWSGDSCCNVRGSATTTTTGTTTTYECKDKKILSLFIANKAQNCSALITEQCKEDGSSCFMYKDGAWSVDVDKLIDKTTTLGFKFYCYNNNNEYNTDTETGRTKHMISASSGDKYYKIELKKNDASKVTCNC